MDLLRVRRLFADEKVARLGHTGPGGQPFLTPVRFALIDDGDAGVVVCTLEVHPRSIASAAQLRAMSARPAVTFLADNPSNDVTAWWVRADAVAEVLRRRSADPRFDMALAALAPRYPDSASWAKVSTVVWGTVTAWHSWTPTIDANQAAA